MTGARIVTPSRMRWRLVVASADGWRQPFVTHNREHARAEIEADPRLVVESAEMLDDRAEHARNEGGETT